MASMYGGQGAANVVGAGISAYSAVEDIKGKQQTREIRAQEASQMSKQREEQIKSAQLLNSKQSMQNDGLAILTQQMQDTQKKLKQTEAKGSMPFINDIVTAVGTDAQSQMLNRAKANLPQSVTEGLGVQNMSTASLVTKNDIQEVTSYIAKNGIDPSVITNDNIQKVIDSGLLVKVDGKISDLSQVVVATGAYKQMTPEQQKIFNTKRDDLVEALTPKEKEELGKQLNKQAAQVAGVSQLPAETDTRATMEKELDYIQEMFPGEDLIETYRALKKTGTSSMSWDERLIMYKQEQLADKGIKKYSPEWKSEMDRLKNQIIVKSTYGQSENVASKEANISVNAENIGAAVIDGKQKGKYPIAATAQLNEKRFMDTPQYKNSDLNNDFKAFKSQAQSAEKVIDLRNKVNEYIDKGGNLGIEKSVMTTMATKLPQFAKDYIPADIAVMDASDIAKSMGIKGEMAILVGEMVKAMYGGQASNQDRQSFEKVLLNGSWDNNFAIKTSVSNLADMVYKSTNRNGENLMRSGLSYTPAKYLNTLSEKYKPITSKKTIADLPALSSKEMQEGYRYVEQQGKLWKINPNTKFAEEVK